MQNLESPEEKVERCYTAAMDSVKLLERDKPAWISQLEWDKTVSSNIKHLELILEKNLCGDKDTEPFIRAIQSAKSKNS